MNNDNPNNSGLWFVMAVIVVPIIVSIGKFFSPDTFVLNSDTNSPIYAHILSPIESVNQNSEDGFSLIDKSAVSLSLANGTQSICEFFVTVHGDSGVVITQRTTKHEFTNTSTKGLSFVYSPHGSAFYENGKLIQTFGDVKSVSGVAERITIENKSNYCSIMVGCRTIMNYKTTLPATEYMIVQTQSNTNATIARITSEPVFEKPTASESR